MKCPYCDSPLPARQLVGASKLICSICGSKIKLKMTVPVVIFFVLAFPLRLTHPEPGYYIVAGALALVFIVVGPMMATPVIIEAAGSSERSISPAAAKKKNIAQPEESDTVSCPDVPGLDRETAPLDWAYAQHNLADAVAAMALRRGDRVQMMEAIVRMRGAIEVYRKVNHKFWVPIAERRLTEMEGDFQKLR